MLSLEDGSGEDLVKMLLIELADRSFGHNRRHCCERPRARLQAVAAAAARPDEQPRLFDPIRWYRRKLGITTACSTKTLWNSHRPTGLPHRPRRLCERDQARGSISLSDTERRMLHQLSQAGSELLLLGGIVVT
ncbi:hypothetical protein [Bradyrhizobium paxllaeri]|uniref:hypothetical protein n=1 Tax=Bradyrhizobium paxllaeri TaxID=190148 RepID=UPI0011471C6B|nr:hypothetical protein [Bradyrhizobium paxllaeri]